MENNQPNPSLWEQRLQYPWIKVNPFHYYCSNCYLPQKLTLSDGPEDLERFIKAHSKCTSPKTTPRPY
jgi:hypothetical protein